MKPTDLNSSTLESVFGQDESREADGWRGCDSDPLVVGL